jgi:hypothetical protein
MKLDFERTVRTMRSVIMKIIASNNQRIIGNINAGAIKFPRRHLITDICNAMSTKLKTFVGRVIYFSRSIVMLFLENTHNNNNNNNNNKNKNNNNNNIF